MRTKLRMLVLALTVLLVPAADAIYMHCFPASFSYYTNIGWRCEFDPGGTQCQVCYAVMVVLG